MLLFQSDLKAAENFGYKWPKVDALVFLTRGQMRCLPNRISAEADEVLAQPKPSGWFFLCPQLCHDLSVDLSVLCLVLIILCGYQTLMEIMGQTAPS